MKNRIAWMALLVLAAIALVGCGGGGGGSNSGPGPGAGGNVTLTSPASTLNVGQTVQLAVKDTNGNSVSLPSSNFQFSSSDQSVLTVTNGGVVTGVANGIATITATELSNSKTGTATLAVGTNVAPVSSITLSAPATTITLGQTSQINAVAKDASGNTINVPAANYQYTSSAPTIATVSASGLVTPKCPGTANITAKETTSNVTSAIPLVFTVPGGDSARTIVFDSTLNGAVISGNPNSDIYALNVDTGVTTRLTNVANAANAPEGTNTNPALSPDGRFIAFQRALPVFNSISQIYSMNADGSSVTPITTNASMSSFHARWSPDNSKIVYATSATSAAGTTASLNVYTVATKTSAPLGPAPQTGKSDFDPEYSPDGTKILFTSDRTGNPEIFVMNADGSGTATNLTNSAGDDFEGVWSPDGSKIAFVSNRSGLRQIWLMNADGSSPKQLTQDATPATKPAFLADGSIVYASATASGTNKLYIIKDVNNPTTSRQQLTSGTSNDDSPKARLCP